MEAEGCGSGLPDLLNARPANRLTRGSDPRRTLGSVPNRPPCTAGDTMLSQPKGEFQMRTQKTAKSLSARTAGVTMIQYGREEELLLERWAASDSARTMDEAGWDESQDRFEIESVSGARYNS